MSGSGMGADTSEAKAKIRHFASQIQTLGEVVPETAAALTWADIQEMGPDFINLLRAMADYAERWHEEQKAVSRR